MRAPSRDLKRILVYVESESVKYLRKIFSNRNNFRRHNSSKEIFFTRTRVQNYNF